MSMSDSEPSKRMLHRLDYVRKECTHKTIRHVNEWCQVWNAIGFADDELVAERDIKTGEWYVYPKGV